MSWKKFFTDLKNEVKEDNISNGAAALAYYLTLAIFPALMLLLSLVPYLPIANVDQAILDSLREMLPPEAVNMLMGIVNDVVSHKSGGLLSVGALGTLWAASNGTFAVMQQLNITYDIKERRPFLKSRAIAVGLTILVGLLVIVAFSSIVVGGDIQNWVESALNLGPVVGVFFSVLRWAIILTAFLLAFALVYYYGPDAEQSFKFITPGSVCGVMVLIGASVLFRYYVSHFGNYSATYGSIGAVVILMLWLYIAGIVVLLGSEVNALVEHYSPKGKQKRAKKLRAA
ncbi:MAG: YihY/virulence factor BrkB family protein [Bdellovibrionia bacterium]